MFGKSKEDKGQDKEINNIWKWIETLNKNQAVLIKNNDYFIKTGKNRWAWIRKLESDNKALHNHISTLESTIKAMKKRDEEFAKMFKGLAAVSTEAVKEEG